MVEMWVALSFIQRGICKIFFCYGVVSVVENGGCGLRFRKMKTPQCF